MKFLISGLIIYIINHPLYAAEGETACGFLKFSNSAKASSLANSYSAYSGGSDMIFTNPAALTNAIDNDLHFTFANYLGGSKLGLFSYKISKNDLNIGFGITAFEIDSIERRLNDTVGIVPVSGSFSNRDTAFLFSFAKDKIFSSFIDNLSGGLTLKIINSKIDDKSGTAFAVDAGFIYGYSNDLRFSFVISNLGTEMKYVSDGDKLPLSIRFGGFYKLNNDIYLLADVEDFIYDEKIYPSLGFEWQVYKKLVLRAGYRFGYDTSNLGSLVGLGIGFGVVTKEISLGYAYVPFGDLGDVNKFDISIRF